MDADFHVLHAPPLQEELLKYLDLLFFCFAWLRNHVAGSEFKQRDHRSFEPGQSTAGPARVDCLYLSPFVSLPLPPGVTSLLSSRGGKELGAGPVSNPDLME